GLSPRVSATSAQPPTGIVSGDTAATAPPASSASPRSSADLQRLKARVDERWRVVRTRDGLVLMPRQNRSRAVGVELSRDQILIDGQPVTGSELRARVGGDAESLIALSYLDGATRADLFAPPSDAPAPQVSSPPDTPPLPRSIARRHGARVRLGSSLV